MEDDHVLVFLDFPPRYAIARVVGILKSISASRTFARFSSLRRKFWSGELREDGYAARTVGDQVTSDLIRRYTKRHAIEQATKKPELFCVEAAEAPLLGRVGSLVKAWEFCSIGGPGDRTAN